MLLSLTHHQKYLAFLKFNPLIQTLSKVLNGGIEKREMLMQMLMPMLKPMLMLMLKPMLMPKLMLRLRLNQNQKLLQMPHQKLMLHYYLVTILITCLIMVRSSHILETCHSSHLQLPLIFLSSHHWINPSILTAMDIYI
jgi:hypothetical protein